MLHLSTQSHTHTYALPPAVESKQCVLDAQVLANVPLVQDDIGRGLKVAAVLGWLRGHAKAKGHVCQRIHDWLGRRERVSDENVSDCVEEEGLRGEPREKS